MAAVETSTYRSVLWQHEVVFATEAEALPSQFYAKRKLPAYKDKDNETAQ